MKNQHPKSPSQLSRTGEDVRYEDNSIAYDNEPAAAAGKQQSAWSRFWFTPANPLSLHTLRVLTGVVLLCWLLFFVGHQSAFFGLEGWFDAQAYQESAALAAEVREPLLPFNWSILYLFGDSSAMVNLAYWISIGIVALFTFGLAPRLTALLTWLVVVSFIANPVVSFGADYLLVLPVFYLLIGYMCYGQWNRTPSALERIFGPADALIGWRYLLAQSDLERPQPSYAANLALRLFQVHFALMIVTSALHKLQIGEWWGGVALWYPLHSAWTTTPQGVQTTFGAAESYLFVLSLATYLLLIWQLAFPMFAWRAGWWRGVLLGGAVIGWIGSFFVWQLPMFGPLLFVGCVSFLTADELRGAWSGLGKILKRAPSEATADTREGGKKIKAGAPRMHLKTSRLSGVSAIKQ